MAKEETAVEVIEEPTNVEETEEELSPWYYFFSQGCGWCKKSSPIIEELIDNGHDILMLDLAEPDNQKLNQELKAEFGTQCGTPWFINAETGKGVCGFREKEQLELWLDGKDVPPPPRPTGPPPKTPFYGSTNKENIAWKKEYTKWLKDNDHMGDNWKQTQKSANEIIDGPRMKSDPPRPPMGQALASATDEALDKWGSEMEVWQKENNHLPNLQPVTTIVNQMKQRRDQMATGGQQGGPAAGVNNAQLNTMDARVQALEVKIDKIISHFGVK
jgi:hypothetical protein